MSLDSSTQIQVVGSNGQAINCWDEWTPPGYTREIFARNFADNRGERVLLCAWNDRIALATALLGGATTAGTIYPAVYPDVQNWICQRIEISGDGLPSIGVNKALAFDRARCRCIFQPPQWDPSNVGTGEIELDFSGNAIALDPNKASFQYDGSTDVPPGQMPVLRFTTVTVLIARYDLITLPISTIISSIDHVNNATFLGAATEQVVFKGARSRKKFTTTGALNWDVTYAFEVKCSGTWNQTWQSGASAGWKDYTIKGGGKYFPLANLNLLLA